MNYNEWVINNWIELSHNYNNRNINSSFDEFSFYIYTGIQKKCWLPEEYTIGIINK